MGHLIRYQELWSVIRAKIKGPVGTAVALEGFEISGPDVDETRNSLSVDQGEQHCYRYRLL